MRTWKQLFGCLLAGAMALSLAACGSDSTATDDQTTEDQAQEETTPSTDVSADTTPEASDGETTAAGSNVLVVYYSATGNTENAASYIAQATGGDLFEITPAEPYTDDDLNWSDENSRVVYEYENPEERDVALAQETPTGWDDYDVVFLGYPIWWGIAAWPVSSFVAANDFDGKTVIPFCTSSSSGLGESGDLLADLADAGTWLEGRRFRGGASQADVAAWVESLDLA